jgi:hypothetical protein
MAKYRHGTIQRYEDGCRCPLCKLANLKYQRDAYPCNKKTIKLPKKAK